MIHRAFFGFVGVRDVIEVKSLFVQFIFVNIGFSMSVFYFFHQDFPVLAQDIIYRAHVVGGVAVLLIVAALRMIFMRS